jgi:hypothetical protein
MLDAAAESFHKGVRLSCSPGARRQPLQAGCKPFISTESKGWSERKKKRGPHTNMHPIARQRCRVGPEIWTPAGVFCVTFSTLILLPMLLVTCRTFTALTVHASGWQRRAICFLIREECEECNQQHLSMHRVYMAATCQSRFQ